MRTLLVQTSFLGDTILSTPLIGALRTLYPDSELWVMTTPAARELLRRDPQVDGIIPFDKRKSSRGLFGLLQMARSIREMRFAQVYSLHRSFRTSVLLWLARIPRRVGFQQANGAFLYTETRERSKGVHDVLRNLSLLGDEIDDLAKFAHLRLTVPASHEVSETVRLAVQEDAPFYLLFPGSVWKTKRWDWRHYQNLARYYLKSGKRIVVLGGSEDREIAQWICEPLRQEYGASLLNLAGLTSLGETMYLVSKAEIVICNDSMSLHLASALHTPNVAIFCATSPEFGFGPWNNNAIVVEKEGLPCKPCRRHGSHTCPTGTESCMRDLPPEEVIRAVGKVLDT